jgi:hypothetical protein
MFFKTFLSPSTLSLRSQPRHQSITLIPPSHCISHFASSYRTLSPHHKPCGASAHCHPPIEPYIAPLANFMLFEDPNLLVKS